MKNSNTDQINGTTKASSRSGDARNSQHRLHKNLGADLSLREGERAGAALVTVVIPCYEQAHFLGEAIESVLAQSYPHFEVVVVDDGSTDDTAQVAGRYPRVRLLRQENRGPSEARNVGLRHGRGEYVVFLDADDRLLPGALEVGVGCLEARPECALVAGHYRFMAADGSSRGDRRQQKVESEPYVELLRGNYIGMQATVVYRRSVLEAVGGFDASLKGAEDYELYFRITKQFPVCQHDKVVVEYRQHAANATRNSGLMLRFTLTVLSMQWKDVKGNPLYREAYKAGIRYWRDWYGAPFVNEVRASVREREWRAVVGGVLLLLRFYPRGLASLLLPAHVRRWLRILRRPLRNRPPVGWVRFGSLRRVTPISREFGYDRGRPIDRYYIEKFLDRQTEDIQGHVLEIGDDTYTRRFGGGRVDVSDVLHVSEGNPQATIVADLVSADDIPSDTFDCIILTQTLHLIYEVRAAILTLHRILKPGGVLLATFPGISQIARDQWGERWYWALTSQSARRLFEEAFPPENVVVEPHGNALAAISFLHGLAEEELRREELEYHDPYYEVLIALRAEKPAATP